MRFAVISHGASLLALGKARNHGVLLETVAFYSVLGKTCKGTALKGLQGAGIRLRDQLIDRLMDAFCLLPSPTSQGRWRAAREPATVLLGGLPREERWYSCWWRTHPRWPEAIGRTTGSFGWWLCFLVSGNSRVCVAVSFSRKGLCLQKFARFY